MTSIVEKSTLRGIFQMRLFKDAELLDEFFDHNLIVDKAKIQMAHLLAGDVKGRHIAKIAFGTSGAEQKPSDILITNQWAKNISGVTYPHEGRVQFNWELLVTENNGMAILEFGLLTEDGTLFARKIRDNPIYKASDISIEGHWTILF